MIAVFGQHRQQPDLGVPADDLAHCGTYAGGSSGKQPAIVPSAPFFRITIQASRGFAAVVTTGKHLLLFAWLFLLFMMLFLKAFGIG